MKRFAYGTDEENLNYDGIYESYKDGIKDAILECDAEVGDTIYGGEVVEFTPTISVDAIIDSIQEEAYGECGEHGADYLSELSNENRSKLEDVLNTALLKFLRKNKQMPYFYKVKREPDVEVTQEMIDRSENE